MIRMYGNCITVWRGAAAGASELTQMLSPLLPNKVSTLVSVILNIKVFSVPDRLARLQTISVTYSQYLLEEASWVKKDRVDQVARLESSCLRFRVLSTHPVFMSTFLRIIDMYRFFNFLITSGRFV